MTEKVKGHKGLTPEQIALGNEIKELEAKFGKLLTAFEEKLFDDLTEEDQASLSYEDYNQRMTRIKFVQVAKDRLREASMWGCRAVFNPEESY